MSTLDTIPLDAISFILVNWIHEVIYVLRMSPLTKSTLSLHTYPNTTHTYTHVFLFFLFRVSSLLFSISVPTFLHFPTSPLLLPSITSPYYLPLLPLDGIRYWRDTWKTVKFPSRMSVFDSYLNPETHEFEPWSNSPYFFSIDYDSTCTSTVLQQYGISTIKMIC